MIYMLVMLFVLHLLQRSRLYNAYIRVSTVNFHEVRNGNLTDMPATTIKNNMVIGY